MDRISRADLLKTGAGLTLLAVVGGCAPERKEAQTKRAMDPKLVRYRESGRIEPGYHWVRDVAALDGDVWTAGDMSVACFGRDGRKKESFDLKADAQAVAVSPGGTVYAATSDQVVPLEGKPWTSLGPRARIVSLAATEREVYAADAGNRVLIRFDRRGNELGRIEGFVVPSPYFGLAISGDRVLVSNPGRHRVERYQDGKADGTFGLPGQEIESFCGCCNPTNLAVLASGDIVTSEKGIPRVKVLSPDGTLKAVVAPPESFHAQSAGLALAVDGERIYVLDPWEGAIRAYDPI